MSSLAIVIPAYKLTFFERTILSITRQTCKDFTLYVGNDCASNEIGEICERYKSEIDIVYHRFTENLGGKDLVAQWERCIKLTQGERWIWLFSDDDVMGEKCVELFYKFNNKTYDLFHFDVKVIDEGDMCISSLRPYPEVISGRSMLIKKQSLLLSCFVVEYIFSRKIYLECGGFQNFPLGWGSDVATWAKFSKEHGIYTITGDYVYWRQSSENISPQKSKDIVLKKLLIEIDYYLWIKNFYRESINGYCLYFFFRSLISYSLLLDFKDIKMLINIAKEKGLCSNYESSVLTLSIPFLRVAKKIKSLFSKHSN